MTDGIVMKSIVEEALAKHEEERIEPPVEETPTTTEGDEELEKIIDKLKTNIKIIGCGGGGSNTINNYLSGANIVFLTSGLGGGTGTGAAPVIASIAKETGALVMSIVTMPFQAEGKIRMQNAEFGLEKMRQSCDTTITIYNDKLLELVPKLPINAAFKVADEILMQSIKGITEIITKPGLVNLDYNDLATVMRGGGVAMIGIGESDDDRERVEQAINEALSSPLLGEIDLSHARGAMVRVIGGPDMTVTEAEKAVELVGEKINPMARIIWGCSVDPTLGSTIKVLLVITGVKSPHMLGKESTLLDDKGIDEIK
jgi:cell division protein FtsZ